MPNVSTHRIAGEEIKKELIKNNSAGQLDNIIANNQFSSHYNQGHDYLFYQPISQSLKSDVIKGKNIAYFLQQKDITRLVYEYFKFAEKNNVLEKAEIRNFMYGYLSHHMLDSLVHPMIIFYAGDINPNSELYTKWNHGILETCLDLFMLEYYENRSSFKNISKDFSIGSYSVSDDLTNIINGSFHEVYNFLAGNTFKIGIENLERFVKLLKEDNLGLKSKFFNGVNKFGILGPESFSYSQEEKNKEYLNSLLNKSNNEWCNPFNPDIISRKSFVQQFEYSIKEISYVIVELEKMLVKGIVSKHDISDLVKDVSAITGLSNEDVNMNNIVISTEIPHKK